MNILNNFSIFKKILIYLVHDNRKFSRILEYSLLSKSIFKFLQQYIISHEFNKHNFILSIDQFIEYLKNCKRINLNFNTSSNNINNINNSYTNRRKKVHFKIGDIDDMIVVEFCCSKNIISSIIQILNTLHCNYTSYKVFFKHCIENHYIKKLVITIGGFFIQFIQQQTENYK